MCLKRGLITLDLVVTSLEALNQVVEFGNGYLEVLAFVALIVGQIVNLIWFLEKLGHLQLLVVADEVVRVSTSPVSVHIRKVSRHHSINDSHSEVSGKKRRRHIKIVDVRATHCLRETKHVSRRYHRWVLTKLSGNRLLLELDLVLDGDHLAISWVQHELRVDLCGTGTWQGNILTKSGVAIGSNHLFDSVVEWLEEALWHLDDSC